MRFKKQILYLLLAAMPVILGVVGWFDLFSSPYIGINFAWNEQEREGARITSIDPNGPAAKLSSLVGAAVIEIEGFPLWPHDLGNNIDLMSNIQEYQHWWKARYFFSKNIQIGVPLHLTVLEGKTEKQIEIIPTAPPFWQTVLLAGPLLFTGLFSLLIGSIVIFKKEKDPIAKLFFVMTLISSFLMIPGSISVANEIIISDARLLALLWNIIVVALFLLPPSVLHFVMLFPHKQPIMNDRLIFPVMYLIPVPFFWLYWTRIFFPALHLFQIGFFSVIVIFLISGWRNISIPEARAQSKWILFGIALNIVVFIIAYILPTLFPSQMFYSYVIPSVVFLAIPLSMAFAIVRYRLMDIDTLIDNTIIYTIAMGGLILLDVGAIAILERVKQVGIPLSGILPSVLIVWFSVAAYMPIRNWVKNVVKRLLKREVYDLHHVLLGMNTHLISVTHDLKAILGNAIQTTEAALHPTAIIALLYKENLRVCFPNMTRFPSAPSSLETEIALARTLHQGQEIDGGGMLIPLIGKIRPLGFFLLNRKHSGNLYSSEDRELLEIIADQTTLAVEQFYSIEMYDQKEKELIAAQARISRDIHDGIGGAISSALMIADTIERDQGSGRLEGIKTVLSNGLSDLRGLFWMMEENNFTVGKLVTHISEKFGPIIEENSIGISVALEIENEGRLIPPTAGLNIFRVFQEALTNAMKHADATEIHLSVVERGGVLTAKVSDNGKGFDIGGLRPHGQGLLNFKKRAEEIGAELSIVSEVGIGTIITISLDYKSREDK